MMILFILILILMTENLSIDNQREREIPRKGTTKLKGTEGATIACFLLVFFFLFFTQVVGLKETKEKKKTKQNEKNVKKRDFYLGKWSFGGPRNDLSSNCWFFLVFFLVNSDQSRP